jgi:hypothetical protein
VFTSDEKEKVVSAWRYYLLLLMGFQWVSLAREEKNRALYLTCDSLWELSALVGCSL